MSGFLFLHQYIFKMRVAYITPSVRDFEIILSDGLIRGGKLSDIRYLRNPRVYQRGSGILSFLGGLARKTIPFLLQHILPEAGNLYRNVSRYLNEGKSARTAMKKHGINALKNVGKRVLGGKKRKNSRICKKTVNKRKKNPAIRDVFC